MGSNQRFVKQKYKKTRTVDPNNGATISHLAQEAEKVVVRKGVKKTRNGFAFTIRIKAISPIHLSSGQADVNKDSDVIHDKFGLPYFPAKRLKGLLYESAIEVKEMAETAGMTFINQKAINELFQHDGEKDVQLIAEDLHIENYEIIKPELEYLESRYPGVITAEDVLQEFTSIRYQTAINKETGTALKFSLRNIRVVDEGIIFTGRWEIRNACQEHLEVLALAMQNLSAAGGRRNRGFGQISCAMAEQEKYVEQALGKEAM